MITDFRTDLNQPELPFLIGEMGKWNKSYEGIRKVILSVPKHIPNTWIVPSDGLTPLDQHHFDTESQRILGQRYADLYLEIGQ